MHACVETRDRADRRADVQSAAGLQDPPKFTGSGPKRPQRAKPLRPRGIRSHWL